MKKKYEIQFSRQTKAIKHGFGQIEFEYRIWISNLESNSNSESNLNFDSNSNFESELSFESNFRFLPVKYFFYKSQLFINSAWDNVWQLTNGKSARLKDALREAEELHKSVNMLLEWLSDAEMKLRFSGPLPEDEEEVMKQIADHEKFMAELKEKEKDKDFTLKLAHEILAKCHPDAVSVIKHWITIIQSRWDEVASWALQRMEKLQVNNILISRIFLFVF